MSSPFSELSGLTIKIPSGNPHLSYLPTSTHSAMSTFSQISAYSATSANSPLPVDSPSTDAFTNSPYAELDGVMSPSVSYTICAPQFSVVGTPKSQHNKEIICTTPNTINNILRNKRRTRHRRSTLGTSNNTPTPTLAASATPLTPTPVQDITFNFETIDISEEESKEQKALHTNVSNYNKLHVLIENDDAPNITDISSVEEEKEEEASELVSEDAMSEVRVLSDYGYVKRRKITDTLQGTVFIAIDNNNNKNSADSVVVIKRTAKVLHNKGITIQNGKEYAVNENVLKEYQVLAHFTSQENCPTQITKALNFFQSVDNYYLVMQNAGDDFFDFIVRAHKLINDKKLKIKEWRKFVKYLFYQMAVVVDWLHNQQNCCHLDISLENITVKHATFILQKDGYFTINTNIRIKFIDFGLAEFFDPAQSFQCVKYCGKTAYKAPEIYRSRQFDARKADVWSLGVVLFCMAVGSPPYVKPSNRDDAYKYFIKTGKIEKLLFQWNRHFCVTVKMLDLLKRMLRVNIHKRYTMERVLQHAWLAVYHKQYKQYKTKRFEQQIFDHVSIYKLPVTCSV